MIKGWLSEIFDSIQGEGIYLGVRQIFFRFSGCNLGCSYCDTPKARKKQKYCAVRLPYSKFNNLKLKNPITIDDILLFLRKYLSSIQCPARHLYHSVSLTGGEPLLQVDFLRSLIPPIRESGFKIYLETNGTLPDALKKVVNEVDFIAMDIKLPTATGQEFWKEHKKFLKLGVGKMGAAPIFVKVVITPKTIKKEIKKASKLIAEVNRKIPLVLQPIWGLSQSRFYRDGTVPFLMNYQEIAGKILKDVRIIPQLHKILNLP